VVQERVRHRKMRSHADAAIGRGGSDLKGWSARQRTLSQQRFYSETRTLAHGPMGSGGSERVNCLVNPSNSIQTFSPETALRLQVVAWIDVF
jgi:hypothetical protein